MPRPASKASVHFTFKYRLTDGGEWKWANEVSHTSDGELNFQPPLISKDLSQYLHGVDRHVKIQNVQSESPNVQLWSIDASVEKAKGAKPGKTKISLGVPVDQSRWFACVRTWTPWLAPRHGNVAFAPKQDAILACFLRYDGLHLILLAVSGIKDVLTVFQGDGKGNVIAMSQNDREEEGQISLLAAVAKTPEAAIASVMYQARHLVADNNVSAEAKKLEVEQNLSDGVKAQWMENWYDGLTYCTWNGLGQDLTEEKILQALADLKKQNINITNLIIDDNWQTLGKINEGATQFDLGWSDFDANPKAFPHGLKHTATTIREKYPNIQHIAVWHAILGYWGAIDPNGKIAHSYKTKIVNRSGGRKMTVVAAEDIDRMYDDFYEILLSAGVDSVKTDAQFMLDEIEDANDRRELINSTQDAWTIAALRHFSIKAISCMSQFPQCIFHTQLPTNKPQFMVRNSDDFFPDIPSSHPYHIFTNALNSIFTSHLNTLPDWDMFQTYHDYSAYHAAGRCISGGPIYITDEPGKHNLDLIRQMTAQDIQGKTVVLRPSTVGKSVNVYTAYEEEKLLKVGTFVGGKGGTSIVALFNVSKRLLMELVNLSCFPGIEKGQQYVVRAHTTGELSSAMSLDSPLPILCVEVDVKGYEIFSAYPLQSFQIGTKESVSTQVAVLGLLGKMTGAAAVLKTETRVDHGRLFISTNLKALGRLGIYISKLRGLSVEDNFLVVMRNEAVPKEYVTINKDSPVLEIDIEHAWQDLGLQPGYGNEIDVEIMMSFSK